MTALFFGPEVQRIRSEDPLVGSPLLCYGSSTELYDACESVLRLSTDAASHCFVILAGRHNLAVPECRGDWGAVGVSDEYPDWDCYWLGAFEKLRPIEEGNLEYGHLVSWLEAIEEESGISDSGLIALDEVVLVRDALFRRDWPNIHPALVKTLHLMTDLCRKFKADLDLSPDNFMRRESTGEILITDPAHGAEISPDLWLSLGGGQGWRSSVLKPLDCNHEYGPDIQ